MADQDAASWAFPLPGFGISPGQAMEFQQQQNAQERARQDQLEAQRLYRQDQERDRNELRQGNVLKELDPLKYHTGLQKVDDFTDKKVSDIIREMSKPEYAKLPINEFTALVGQHMMPVKSGYSAVKNKLAQEEATIKAVAHDNPYIDDAKLLEHTRDDITNAFMVPDQKLGGYTFGPLDRPEVNQNFATKRLQGKGIYDYINNKGVSDYFANLEKLKTQRKYVVPDQHGETTFEAMMSPLQQEDIQAGKDGRYIRAPKYVTAFEKGRIDRNGNPVQALPEDIMQKHLVDTPDKAIVFGKLLHEWAGQMGVNPDDPLEQRKFAYILANTHTADNQPQPGVRSYRTPAPHVTVNNGNSTIEDVADVFQRAKEHAREENPHTVHNNGTDETWGKMPSDPHWGTEIFDKKQRKTVRVPYDNIYITPNDEIKGVINKRDERGKIIPGRAFEQIYDIPKDQYVERMLNSVPGKLRIKAVRANLEHEKAPEKPAQSGKKVIKGF